MYFSFREFALYNILYMFSLTLSIVRIKKNGKQSKYGTQKQVYAQYVVRKPG